MRRIPSHFASNAALLRITGAGMGMVARAGRVASIDVTSRLEASALAKVQAACNFVNAETDRVRNQTIGIAVMCSIGGFVLSSLTGLGDARVPLVLAAGISVFFVVRARTELATSFRSIAAKRIVAGLGRELTYHPGSSLTRRHFAAMDLFTEHCERWRSSDEIAGRVQGVKYSLHRVTASGADRRQAPIFQGVIIKIDFDDAFPAHTVVVPDNNGLLTFASKGAITSGRKKDLVMMKNPAFERMFSVHSTDYYEARQLVTPWFMKLVMEAQATLGTELRLCFLQRSLYVTVAGDTLRFRPALFSEPLTPQAAVGMLVHLVALAQRLAEIRASS